MKPRATTGTRSHAPRAPSTGDEASGVKALKAALAGHIPNKPKATGDNSVSRYSVKKGLSGKPNKRKRTSPTVFVDADYDDPDDEDFEPSPPKSSRRHSSIVAAVAPTHGMSAKTRQQPIGTPTALAMDGGGQRRRVRGLPRPLRPPLRTASTTSTSSKWRAERSWTCAWSHCRSRSGVEALVPDALGEGGDGAGPALPPPPP